MSSYSFVPFIPWLATLAVAAFEDFRTTYIRDEVILASVFTAVVAKIITHPPAIFLRSLLFTVPLIAVSIILHRRRMFGGADTVLLPLLFFTLTDVINPYNFAVAWSLSLLVYLPMLCIRARKGGARIGAALAFAAFFAYAASKKVLILVCTCIVFAPLAIHMCCAKTVSVRTARRQNDIPYYLAEKVRVGGEEISGQLTEEKIVKIMRAGRKRVKVYEPFPFVPVFFICAVLGFVLDYLIVPPI